MAYDIYTPISTPVIPVSLYADAAKAGAQVGTMIPTTTTAIINGLVQGIGQGQSLAANAQSLQMNQNKLDMLPVTNQQEQEQLTQMQQTNQIRQNQIDNLPTTNELTQEQLEAQKQQNEIQALQLEIDKATKDLRVEATRAELEAKKDQVTFSAQSQKGTNLALKALADPNPENLRNALNDPSVQLAMNNNSQLAEKVVGKLKGAGLLTPEEEQKYNWQIDYAKERDRQIRAEAERSKTQKKESDYAEKVEDELALKAPGAAAKELGFASWDDFVTAKGVEVVPDGPPGFDMSTPAGQQAAAMAGQATKSYTLKYGDKKSTMHLSSEEMTKLINYMKVKNPDNLITPQAPAQAPPAAPAPKGEFSQSFAGARDSGKSEATFSVQPNVPVVPQPPAAAATPAAAQATPAATAQPTPQVTPTAQRTPSAQPVPAPAPAFMVPGADSSDPQVRQAAIEYQSRINAGDEKLAERLAKKGKLMKSAGNEITPVTPNGAAAVTPTQTPSAAPTAAPTPVPAPPQPIAPVAAVEGAPEVSLQNASYVAPAPTVAQVHDSLAPQTKKYVNAGALERVQSEPMLADLPPFYKAVVAQESAGKADAVSPTGVKGFFQLTRPTAKQMGVDRNVPAQNIIGGVKYLNLMLKQFNGDPVLALMAYNGGPGLINAAVNRAGSTDYQDVVNQIQYMQSRGMYAEYLTPRKVKEIAEYPIRVFSYTQAFAALNQPKPAVDTLMAANAKTNVEV